MSKLHSVIHHGPYVVHKVSEEVTTYEGDSISVSDGYHTMNELYEHRFHLFIALLKIIDQYVTPFTPKEYKAWKSKFHADGTMFPGWFIAGIRWKEGNPFEIGATEPPPKELTITYHLPLEYWNKLPLLMVEHKAPEWDGHNSDDVLVRLLKL